MPLGQSQPPELPETFPVFPLPGALLLPAGKLPLNIFEPRYLALTEDALAAGRMFAMIQPDEHRPSGETGPVLHGVGCIGRVISFSETGDGRFLITLLGLSRFRVGAELGMRRGYRRVRADYAGFASDLAPAPPKMDREAMLAALKGFFAARGIEANWEAIGRMDDAELVTTLAMVCPFDPIEKQALLEAPDATARAGTLLTLLRMAAHAPRGDAPGRAS